MYEDRVVDVYIINDRGRLFGFTILISLYFFFYIVFVLKVVDLKGCGVCVMFVVGLVVK